MEASQFKSDQYVRFCPGCGDHAICMALQKAMAQIGIPTHDVAVISGIGCSSRMPHYLNTYGFNTIHGRGGAIATGVKTSHPELTVWQMSGDGDCLAIGGNHFIHEIRRNVDLNVCMFNNRIYGLTKGQYSPTSPKGFVSKSSPFGTVERPFVPAQLVLGAGGTFFARTLDVDMPTTVDCLVAAQQHKGCSIVECLVNCVIFNNGTHAWIADREQRAEHSIVLKHGEKMIFGKANDKGLAVEIDPQTFVPRIIVVPADDPRVLRFRVVNEGGAPWAGVLRLNLPFESAEPRFFLPGFMYGTNRGEAPLVTDSKTPRLRRSPTEFPASPWWLTRAARLSRSLRRMAVAG